MTDTPPIATAAEQARAEAEAAKFRAEAEQALANARKAHAEAEAAEHAAAVALLDRQDAERNAAVLAASDERNHVFRFNAAVDGATVDRCIRQLSAWHRLDPGCDIEIIFRSPGGSVIAGMDLFDHICELRQQGHHVTIMARGYAASMAGILLQAADHRVIGKESYLLIHEISSAASGKIGELDDETKFLKKMQDRVVRIFAERSKCSAATIRRNMNRRDWWLSSDEALRYGFVDEVR